MDFPKTAKTTHKLFRQSNQQVGRVWRKQNYPQMPAKTTHTRNWAKMARKIRWTHAPHAIHPPRGAICNAIQNPVRSHLSVLTNARPDPPPIVNTANAYQRQYRITNRITNRITLRPRRSTHPRQQRLSPPVWVRWRHSHAGTRSFMWGWMRVRRRRPPTQPYGAGMHDGVRIRHTPMP